MKQNKENQIVLTLSIVVIVGALAYEYMNCEGILHRTLFWVECVV